MTKYLFIIIVTLSIALCMSVRGCTQAEMRAKEATQVIDNYNKAMNKADKVIYKIREVVKNEEVDCYNDPIPESITSLH